MRISKINAAQLRSTVSASSTKSKSMTNANISANQSPEKLTNYLSNMATVSFAGLSFNKKAPSELSAREINKMHNQATSEILAAKAERMYANTVKKEADAALETAKETLSDSIKNIRYGMENFPLAIREVPNGRCQFFDEYKDGNIARRSYFIKSGDNISVLRIEDRKQDGKMDLIEVIPNNEITSIAKDFKPKTTLSPNEMPTYILVPGRHNPSDVSYSAEQEFHYIADDISSAKLNVKKSNNGKYSATQEFDYKDGIISSIQYKVKADKDGSSQIEQKYKYDNFTPKDTRKAIEQIVNGKSGIVTRVSNNLSTAKDGSARIEQEFYFQGRELEQYTEGNKKAADSLIMKPTKKWVNTH